MIIRNQMNVSSAHPSTAALKRQTIGKYKKRSKKSLPSPSVLMTYGGIFLLIVTLVAIGYQPPRQVEGLAAIAVTDTYVAGGAGAPSVDRVVATTVANDIAQRANLPIASNAAELSVSLAVKSELAQGDSVTITKPQIVEVDTVSRNVQTYTVRAGDTAQTVAGQFGISSTTLKWANGLQGDTLQVGKTLKVLPTDGVLYTVQRGDTAKSLASRYSVSEERIITYNDLEVDGLTAGKQVILPGGTLPTTERPGYVAPQSVGVASYAANFNASAGNRYAYGWCTWYAYERRAQLGRPIGSFWGNASSWGYNARRAGLAVNNTPAPGAIFQTGGGYGGMGHVGIIDSVDFNKGTVTYSDMNGVAGFGRVGKQTIALSDAKARWMFIH